MTQKSPSPTVRHWQPWSDEVAERYAGKYGDHPTSALAVAAAALDGAEVVLDIGCGSGMAVRTAASNLSSGKAIGIDPAPAMVRIARQQSSTHIANARMQFAEGTAEDMPIDDASIDVAMAVCSLSHWFDIPRGLASVARVLRGDGRFIVVEDVFDDPDMGLGRQTIRTAIENAGFQVTGFTEQSHSEGIARIFTARLGTNQ